MTIEVPPLPTRGRDVHKGECGKVLVVAGSTGMTGAGALCSEAVLRSGAGLVTWAIPETLVTIASIKCTEVILYPIPATSTGQAAVSGRELIGEACHEMEAVALGPGLGVAGETGELIRLLVPEIHASLVLDASGLVAMVNHAKDIAKRKLPTVLTPHVGEMARLIGKKVEQINADREGTAKELAKLTNSVVALKGAGTVVTDGERVYINTTGNPGMATAGSGDVLTGIISGLLAQKMTAFDATVLGVYLHGLAGDLAAERVGFHSLLAGDILRVLPAAFMRHAAKQ